MDNEMLFALIVFAVIATGVFVFRKSSASTQSRNPWKKRKK